MEKLFSQLPITIQQAKKSKVVEKKKEPLFAVKKYNSKRHIRVSFYKPISKIVIV